MGMEPADGLAGATAGDSSDSRFRPDGGGTVLRGMEETIMKRVTRWIVLTVILTGATLALADSGGPPESMTGAPAIAATPAEDLCSSCHGGQAENTGGVIELIGAPALYREGAVYTITVRLTSGQTAANASRRWGFQLTAVRMSNGAGAGTFATIAGQGTQIISGTGSLASRRYVEQTSTGTRTGTASPVQWNVQWTAPATDIGAITFYFAGNAANGAQGENGDWIYNGSFASQDTTTATRSTTWGEVKRQYW
jgi:hypothetical protein